MRKRVFISGPMTGFKDYNFPKFDSVEEKLDALGYEAVNPARISRKFKAADIESSRAVFDRMIDEQIDVLRTCDRILMLEGWEKSRGAKKELMTAIACGIEVELEGQNLV